MGDPFCRLKPGVLCVLSGMESEAVVDENAATVTGVTPFDEREERAVGQAVDMFLKNKMIPCTGCAYCRECPKQVNIPKILPHTIGIWWEKTIFQFYNAYSS